MDPCLSFEVVVGGGVGGHQFGLASPFSGCTTLYR